MNPKAMVFDYYGTLTMSISASARRSGVIRVAQVLGVPADLLLETLDSTFTERATGRCGDMLATMSWVATRCGYDLPAERLAAACAARWEVEMEYARRIRSDSVDTLRRVRAQGLRIGVVSDCTHELPECSASLPVAPFVDTTVFSTEMGQRKPHPSMYLAVCETLKIAPTEAIYVGDGGSNELTGATAVGMKAIRLVAEDATEAWVCDAEPTWTGPVIDSLTALTSDSSFDLLGDDPI